MKILRLAFLKIVPAALAAGCLSSCGDPPVSRADYVRFWILASLRAREKGCEPADELEKVLVSAGVTPDKFADSQVRWFDEETIDEVRQGVRRQLLHPQFLSRSKYIRARAVACLRSETAGTRMDEEIARVGALRNFPVESFVMAENIWIGDGDTDGEILEYYRSLEGAKRVPWELWKRLTSAPDWEKTRFSPKFEEIVSGYGISMADWLAMEEIFGEAAALE